MKSISRLYDHTKELDLDLYGPEVEAEMKEREQRQRELSEMRTAYRRNLRAGKQRKETIKTNVIVGFCVFVFFCFIAGTHGWGPKKDTAMAKMETAAAKVESSPKSLAQ